MMQTRFLFGVLNRFFIALSLFAVTGLIVNAQTATVQRTGFDVTNYRIEAQLLPANNQLRSIADVTFVPQTDTRSVTFELNGSLKVESITRIGGVTTVTQTPLPAIAPRTVRRPGSAPLPRQTATGTVAPRPTPIAAGAVVTFVQDSVGVGDLGPSVRIDLGETVTAGTPVTLRFTYAGALVNAEGGPLATKRLAYVGENLSYLLYASRWFPFHDYAADRATAEIFVTVPAGNQVVGYSDEAVTQANVSGNTRYRFVNSKPALIGNFAAGRFVAKNLRFGNQEVQFYTQPGNDAFVPVYSEILGRALEYYTSRFGAPEAGNRLTVAQIDDETLETYSAPGVLFLSSRFFAANNQNAEERLQREAAYQWWGNTVGLKSFDDAWLSQGLAEYSALELREKRLTGAALETLNRELLERALTFEQTASIARAPSTLDDQSSAFQYIVFYKGALVFRLLRETLGAEKFNGLLRTFLNQYRGKNAGIDDFEKLATAASENNLRYFFARWVEGTGVPEFTADYQIIRKRGGTFVARGTVKQGYENLRLPVDVVLRSEGETVNKTATLRIEDTSEDFNLEANGKPLDVVIDPNYKLLRISDELRVSAVARRGIEQFKDGNYAEAQQQLEAALKLDRSNSWVYYHLGLLFLEQRNYDLAIDNFKAALNGNLRPSWLQTWTNIKMGNAYDAKGDRTRAVAAYKRAEGTGDNYDNAQAAVKQYLANAYDPKASVNTTASR